jgi:hypothetical protein
MFIRNLVISFVFGLSFIAVGADASEHEAADPHSPASADVYPHPALSRDPSWASKVMVGIAGMFILAIGVGVVYKIVVPPQVEPQPAHDDHAPAHDAHHH